MDWVGRAIGNVVIERLWRTLKCHHIHLNPAERDTACRAGINQYLGYYNEERPHSSLDDATSDEVYYSLRNKPRTPESVPTTCSLYEVSQDVQGMESTSVRCQRFCGSARRMVTHAYVSSARP